MSNSNKLHIVGIGPGAKEYILPVAEEIVKNSDVLIGGSRNLEVFDISGKEKLVIGNNLDEVCTYITKNISSKRICVLATGDPGLFGIMEYLRDRLEGVEIEVIPGISSFQYFCAKLKLSWDDVDIVSLHGQENIEAVINNSSGKNILVFTGGKYTADKICRKLVKRGKADTVVTVGENLSYPHERLVSGKAEELADMKFDNLALMLVESGTRVTVWKHSTSGIPDDMFIRGDVPMTKQEIRAVLLSKLRLDENSVVYDIGAGTGSVSVECALRCPKGKVFAVEKDKEAIELIAKNIEKFNLNNVEIINAEAPYIPQQLPPPDRVFIGGSGGNMGEIFEWIIGMGGSVRVAINSVTIESVYDAIKHFESSEFEDIEVVNVGVSRGKKVGGKHLMQLINPIYIISGQKGDF